MVQAVNTLLGPVLMSGLPLPIASEPTTPDAIVTCHLRGRMPSADR